MDRRSFLRLFGLAAAAVAATPSIEQIVEVAKAEPEFAAVSLDELNEAVAKHYLPYVMDHYFQTSPRCGRAYAMAY